jgi:hypothetical protein
MEYTREILTNLVIDVVRDDLKEEAQSILNACLDNDFDRLREYAHKYLDKVEDKKGMIKVQAETRRTTFGNIACMELDFLKTRLEYFGRLPKVESTLGISKEMIPDLIARWRDEKLNNLI